MGEKKKKRKKRKIKGKKKGMRTVRSSPAEEEWNILNSKMQVDN